MTFDSRVARPRGVKPIARHLGVLLHGEPVYCVSCGHQLGFTTHGMPKADGPVIALCGDEDGCGHDCVRRYGIPAEMLTPVPDPDDYVRA